MSHRSWANGSWEWRRVSVCLRDFCRRDFCRREHSACAFSFVSLLTFAPVGSVREEIATEVWTNSTVRTAVSHGVQELRIKIKRMTLMTGHLWLRSSFPSHWLVSLDWTRPSLESRLYVSHPSRCWPTNNLYLSRPSIASIPDQDTNLLTCPRWIPSLIPTFHNVAYSDSRTGIADW